jgi:hypothetical protein
MSRSVRQELRSRSARSSACVSTCTDRVLTRNKCVCKPDEKIRGSSANLWCYAHCPQSSSPPYQTFFTGRVYDYIDSSKPRRVCLASDEKQQKLSYERCEYVSSVQSKKAKKNRLPGTSDESKIQDRFVQIVAGVIAADFLARLYIKAQASDAAVRTALAADMRKFIPQIVDRYDLSPATQKRLEQMAKDIIDKASLHEVVTEYRRFLLSGAGEKDVLAENDELILDRVAGALDEKQLSEFLRGAQIQIVGDEGQMYRQISQRQGAFSRISSHHPRVSTARTPHRAVNEEIFGRTYHLLTGKTPEGNTWLQMEASPWAPGVTFLEAFLAVVTNFPELGPPALDHILDFIVHKSTHRNIGPLGSTPYGEWDPIRIESLVKKESPGGKTLQERQSLRVLDYLPNSQLKNITEQGEGGMAASAFNVSALAPTPSAASNTYLALISTLASSGPGLLLSS